MANELHVRYNGESRDVGLADLDLGDLSTDADVRRAAATWLDAPLSKLANFSVDRNAETGDITLRPQAEFGR